METFQIWLSTALTLCILSFLYRDNPFYKLAEHVFVGVSAGYYIALAYKETLKPNLVDALFVNHQWIRGGALLLALLMFMRFFPKAGGLARWPLAFVVGMYAGINVIAFGSGDLVIQLQSTMLNLAGGEGNPISKLLLVAGLACSLLYFYFSREHTGALGVASRVGVWFLMVSFGASFGYTVMSRVSLAIGRARFLLDAGTVAAILALVIAVGLFAWSRTAGARASQGAGGS